MVLQALWLIIEGEAATAVHAVFAWLPARLQLFTHWSTGVPRQLKAICSFFIAPFLLVP